jgi:predicted transposase YbfD/YdcC/membrane-bound inhibitor of C-type lysozyme
LIRCHTVTLVSSEAACSLHIRNIPGATNEIGALPGTLKELHEAYGRTQLIQMLTMDAGNTSLVTATNIVEDFHWDYFSQLKSAHGAIYDKAVHVLDTQGIEASEATYTEKQQGSLVTYHVWRYDLPAGGFCEWYHAQQFIRVQREVKNPETEESTIGNRYYVCSKNIKSLTSHDCLMISRHYWRCENEIHWTADAIFHEDTARLRWSRHPIGILVASVLRMIAVTILAVVRSLSHLKGRKEKPTWRQVVEHFVLQFCGSVLHTGTFDVNLI